MTEIDIKKIMMEKMQESLNVKAIGLTPDSIEQGMKKEGTGQVDDYLGNVMQDALGGMIQQTITSDAFQPVILDPNIYDTGQLYGMSPLLTYLELKGRRSNADSTKEAYNQLTTGFSPQWIGETEDTSPADAAVTPQNAVMYIEALPLSFSKLLQFGPAGAGATKAQLLEFAQGAMREGLDQALVNGDNSANTKKPNGLFKMAEAGYRSNATGSSLKVSDIDGLSANLFEQKKGYATFTLSSETVVNQVKADMVSTLNTITPPYDVTAGVRLASYAGSRGDIPMIVDPFTPNTAGARQFGMFNERQIFLRDILNNVWVEKGVTKPLAEEGWLIQASMFYHVSPGQTAVKYNLA